MKYVLYVTKESKAQKGETLSCCSHLVHAPEEQPVVGHVHRASQRPPERTDVHHLFGCQEVRPTRGHGDVITHSFSEGNGPTML
jgi:hypothetical protein